MNQAPAERGIPTISRVTDDTVVELVYNREKKTTALVVSRFDGLWNIERVVRLGTECLIPYSARNNLIANGCVLLPSEPMESGPKSELIADIAAFLHRYVDLTPLFERIAAHYILMTWVYDAFNELPLLRLRGDLGSGKTRGLIAIGSVCYRPFFASGASSVAGIFRTIDAFGGTLILDEADFRFSDKTSDLIKLLNNSTVRGMPILRTVVNNRKEYDPYAFKVFGPKIIAMRGSFEDAALESRFLTEETGLRPLRADVPIHLPPSLHDEALELRNRLLHFRLCNYFKTRTDPNAVSAELDPRLNQTALSLLSLVDDTALRREIVAELIRQNEAVKAERSDTLEGGVIQALIEVFASTKAAFIAVGDVADRFNSRHIGEYGHTFTKKWIGGIIRRRLRLEIRRTHGVYVIPASEYPKLQSLALRYGVTGQLQTEENADIRNCDNSHPSGTVII
jgi:hypothetical protein